MFSKESSECGLGMRKYLYWIGLLAAITLVGSYWYLNYFLDEIGFDAHEVLIPQARVRAQVGAPQAPLAVQAMPGVPGMVVSPVAWPANAMVAPPLGGLNQAAVGEASFATVVRNVLPAVVNVSTQNNTVAPKPALAPAQQALAGSGTLQFASPYSGVALETLGSGVIVTADGYVVSNYHVVENSKNVFVTVFGPAGNQRYPADVIQQDAARDLVLLKIQPMSPLRIAPLGNSDELQVGEPVITVGCPFGLDQTVSKGIVSGLRKAVTIEGVIHSNLVQTDAAINQGNSGGPLVAANGHVIGINTAIYSPTQAFSGVGFAVPVNTVRDFLNEVIQLPDVARGVNLPMGPQQVAVRRVPPPIPANSVAPHGDRGPCESCHQIIRTGQLMAQNVQPGLYGTMPMDVTGRNVAIAPPSVAPDNALGATFKSVDAYLLQRFRPPSNGGVFVTQVAQGSPSEQAGLVAGDLIFKMNGRWVRTPEELQAMLATQTVGDKVRLDFMRNQERREISVTLAAPAAVDATAQPVAAPIYPCMPTTDMQPVGLGLGLGPRARQGGCVAAGAMAQPVAAPMTAAVDAGNAVAGGQTAATPPAKKTPVRTEFEWQGMELVPITTAMVTQDPTLKGKAGAVVKELDPGLQADMAGVKANDVVLAINGSPVSSNAELDKAITATNQASTILLDVERSGQRLLVTLK